MRHMRIWKRDMHLFVHLRATIALWPAVGGDRGGPSASIVNLRLSQCTEGGIFAVTPPWVHAERPGFTLNAADAR